MICFDFTRICIRILERKSNPARILVNESQIKTKSNPNQAKSKSSQSRIKPNQAEATIKPKSSRDQAEMKPKSLREAQPKPEAEPAEASHKPASQPHGGSGNAGVSSGSGTDPLGGPHRGPVGGALQGGRKGFIKQ